MGHRLRVLGRRAESLAALEEAVAIAESLDSPGHLARCLTEIGRQHMERGSLGVAEAWLRRALPMFEGIDNRRGQADCANTLGATLFLQGRMDEAQSLLERSQAIARRAGNRGGQSLATLNLGVVQLQPRPQSPSAGSTTSKLSPSRATSGIAGSRSPSCDLSADAAQAWTLRRGQGLLELSLALP
jgi:tetratricopeptide (TPR) repeat protein